MKQRIKEIRKALKLTQAEFGQKMCLSGNYIYMLESTETPISEKVSTLICNTFDVDRHWMETGEGEMFTTRVKEKKLADIVAIAYKRDDLPPETENSFYRILETVAEMNEDQIKLVIDIAKKIAKEEQ